MRFLIALLILCAPAWADSTGFTLVGTGSTHAGFDMPWTSPGNVTTLDAVFATCAPGTGGITNWLRGVDAPFSVPSDATVTGIEVRISIKASATGHEISEVYLIKTAAHTGTGKFPGTAVTTTLTSYTYGGSADMWGTSLTPTDLNASDFGFEFIAADGDSGSETSSVDAMWVNVHYTPAVGGTEYDGAALMALEGE